ncbi:Predicted protein [Taphrina deformans PYCC 5710]|uniref:FAM192A/Fyv6 N-terminal domain-containing protein n=1 Tax=Taphrina deformans (strain PYCC 5710 / ATCC 11124 / CBS 356.35 / IMI 108563 / JCM 9778 / NBRC 8474) TaxID=1097556 RepID=R4X7J5_TAPDE|nr:Predicted protein [Taphrina deformans PYCC 5710]|eukprot:CCG81083.1 Predicted protein [Taphrina deformans PYCC 5710]
MSKFVTGNDDQDDEAWQSAHANDPVRKLEPVDNRSLFEKLQEQKAAKEDALNEATKFSNLIRRLDNDEIDFLVGVNEQKERENAIRLKEQREALEKFRAAQKAVDNLESTIAQNKDLKTQDRLRSVDEASKQKQESQKRKHLAVTGVVKKDRKKLKEVHKSTPKVDDAIITMEPSETVINGSDLPKATALIAYGSDSD